MPTSPIAKEIKNASGYSSMDEVRDSMPNDPDSILDEPSIGRSKKRSTKTKKGHAVQPAPSSDPFTNDKRYQEACSEMSALGGKGMIIGSFDMTAKILKDDSFKLKQKEERQWDNFFYVLSKKATFDVGHPIYLIFFFLITLSYQIAVRFMERTEAGQLVKEFFTPKPIDKENVNVDEEFIEHND